MKCRCPRCGEGKLFQSYLKVRPVCDACGLNLSQQDSGDGPAVFVMFIVGFLIIPLALWMELALSPPFWLQMLIWPAAIIGSSLALLQPLKAAMIALEYKNKLLAGNSDGFDPAP